MHLYHPELDIWLYGGNKPLYTGPIHIQLLTLPGVVQITGRIAPLYDGKPRPVFASWGGISCRKELWSWRPGGIHCVVAYPYQLSVLTPAQQAFATEYGFAPT